MTNVFQVSIAGVDAGLAASYGDAIERAFYCGVDGCFIPELEETPEILVGTPYEGTQLDLVARALAGDSSAEGVIITKHDLEMEPRTSSNMGPAPFGNRELPTSCLQQMIYNVASGSNPEFARQRLQAMMDTLIAQVGKTFAEQQIFYYDCRLAGNYLGAAYRDALLPIPMLDQKITLPQLIEQIPSKSLQIFDEAVELIAELRAGAAPSI